jgi:hypothetical protein
VRPFKNGEHWAEIHESAAFRFHVKENERAVALFARLEQPQRGIGKRDRNLERLIDCGRAMIVREPLDRPPYEVERIARAVAPVSRTGDIGFEKQRREPGRRRIASEGLVVEW